MAGECTTRGEERKEGVTEYSHKQQFEGGVIKDSRNLSFNFSEVG